MTKTEMAYFRAAKAVSQLSDHRVHVGAVLVYKHRIISSGSNSNTKTDAIQRKLDTKLFGVECQGKLHAESSCLIPFIKRGIDLSGSSIFVYREHKDGSLAMSRPCSRCMSLIRQMKIKNIYYTNEGSYIKETPQM